MANPYVGEIRMFAGSFAPAGWAFCNGQLVAISENSVLFQIIGTTYGGDGQETFALPDLRGRVPLHQGQGPAISQNYQLGEKAGAEMVTLNSQQIPVHTHPLLGSGGAAATQTPNGGIPAVAQAQSYYNIPENPVTMKPGSVNPAGGSQPHENMQPYLAVSFIISLFGRFPSQT